jgi:hypothetical protein
VLSAHAHNRTQAYVGRQQVAYFSSHHYAQRKRGVRALQGSSFNGFSYLYSSDSVV